MSFAEQICHMQCATRENASRRGPFGQKTCLIAAYGDARSVWCCQIPADTACEGNLAVGQRFSLQMPSASVGVSSAWLAGCEQSDALFALLAPSTFYVRPIPERHRIIFYLGHLEAFDWNQVREALQLPAFDAELDHLFSFGIDPAQGLLPSEPPEAWPRREQVEAYARRARLAAAEAFASGHVPEVIQQVCIEHRLEHAETFAYMLHNLAPELKPKAAAPLQTDDSAGPAPRHETVLIPAGWATLGRSQSSPGFGWDNEYDEHSVLVPAFRIDRFKVTNRDYLEFVAAGAAPPHFWLEQNGRWYWRTMFGRVPLPLDWPVYVSHDQAESFAAWKQASLPTEAQFHRAAYGTPEADEGGAERAFPWGNEFTSHDEQGRSTGNFDFAAWDPVPVHATPGGDSAFGVSQLVGNGWEWTATRFAPFPGFGPFSFYPGYSANFFDDSHFVLKGGSARTAAPLLRRSFRNWFRPSYPYLYGAFRCVYPD